MTESTTGLETAEHILAENHDVDDFIGVDERVRRELAELIHPDGPEIEVSGRSAWHSRRETWSSEELIEYASFLVNDILQLDPTDSKISLRPIVARASKINFGPSEFVFRSAGLSLTDVAHEIGYKTERLHLTRAELIERGIVLTQAHGKLTSPILRKLQRDGEFVDPTTIANRFGSIGHFQELTGFPSFKGADAEDLVDWGKAVVRQNPDHKQPLVRSTLDHFARDGKGPGNKKMYGLFPSSFAYQDSVYEALDHERRLEAEGKKARLEQILIDRDEGALPESFLDSDMTAEDVLRKGALFYLALNATGEMSLALEFAERRNIDSATRRLAAVSHRSIAEIETIAVRLGVFDDLWPMYRFQNVDLRLPNAA